MNEPRYTPGEMTDAAAEAMGIEVAEVWSDWRAAVEQASPMAASAAWPDFRHGAVQSAAMQRAIDLLRYTGVRDPDWHKLITITPSGMFHARLPRDSMRHVFGDMGGSVHRAASEAVADLLLMAHDHSQWHTFGPVLAPLHQTIKRLWPDMVPTRTRRPFGCTFRDCHGRMEFAEIRTHVKRIGAHDSPAFDAVVTAGGVEQGISRILDLDHIRWSSEFAIEDSLMDALAQGAGGGWPENMVEVQRIFANTAASAKRNRYPYAAPPLPDHVWAKLGRDE